MQQSSFDEIPSFWKCDGTLSIVFDPLANRNDIKGVKGEIRSFKTMLVRIRFSRTTIMAMISFFLH